MLWLCHDKVAKRSMEFLVCLTRLVLLMVTASPTMMFLFFPRTSLLSMVRGTVDRGFALSSKTEMKDVTVNSTGSLIPFLLLTTVLER